MGEAFTKRVAAEVRAEMARQQISQDKLAGLTGLSQSRISRRLTGDYPFDISELAVIAAALGVPVTHFMPAEAVAS